MAKINIIKYLTIISLFTIFTCSNKFKVSDEDLNSILKNSIIQYHEFKDQKHLNEAFVKLKLNKNYNKQLVSDTNSQLVITLLFNMKKYDDIINLLENTKNINEYNRLITLNIAKYLKFKNIDKQKANLFIKKNITRINDSLNKEVKDSLIYLDYFSMKMFISGKETAIKEIDSMQISNETYSNMFYEILKESIEVYPNEHL